MKAKENINKEEEDSNVSTKREVLQLAELYLSTSEALARYAFEATCRQQQMNMMAQQVTVNSVRTLYSIFTLPTDQE